VNGKHHKKVSSTETNQVSIGRLKPTKKTNYNINAKEITKKKKKSQRTETTVEGEAAGRR
jgi:hypothetical protein